MCIGFDSDLIKNIKHVCTTLHKNEKCASKTLTAHSSTLPDQSNCQQTRASPLLAVKIQIRLCIYAGQSEFSLGTRHNVGTRVRTGLKST